MRKSLRTPRFHGLKSHSPRRNRERILFSSSAKNTVTPFAFYKSAERRTRSMVIPWSSAVAHTSDRQARSAHSESSGKRRSRPEPGALKPLPVARHAHGRRKKRHASRRSFRRF